MIWIRAINIILPKGTTFHSLGLITGSHLNIEQKNWDTLLQELTVVTCGTILVIQVKQFVH